VFWKWATGGVVGVIVTVGSVNDCVEGGTGGGVVGVIVVAGLRGDCTEEGELGAIIIVGLMGDFMEGVVM